MLSPVCRINVEVFTQTSSDMSRLVLQAHPRTVTCWTTCGDWICPKPRHGGPCRLVDISPVADAHILLSRWAARSSSMAVQVLTTLLLGIFDRQKGRESLWQFVGANLLSTTLVPVHGVTPAALFDDNSTWRQGRAFCCSLS